MQTDKQTLGPAEGRSHTAYALLKVVFGVVPIVAGLDKFFNLLTDWTQYLSPYAARLVGGHAHEFMMVVGVVEIVAGLLVLSRWTQLGAYVVSAWLVGIALNLVSTGHFFDVAVRDLVMAASAFALAQLAGARAPVVEQKTVKARRVPVHA